MSSLAWQFKTTVLSGHRIEVVVPGLPEGRPATVVVLADAPAGPKRRLSENIGNYRGGKLFKTAEEVDA
ncbi:MAG TPA: hypothetical protein VG406_11135 [Isosphaeraceae bacterium]|jgi:hypothetical protein|nr:hypothetical protein [Isosphaeraceae bacterium]